VHAGLRALDTTWSGPLALARMHELVEAAPGRSREARFIKSSQTAQAQVGSGGFVARVMRLRIVIALGLLSAMAGMMLAGYRSDSVTRDEPLHFIRGLSYLWTGDARLSYAHPPVGNALSALPAALTAKRVDIRAWPEWQDARVEATFQRYLREVGFERADHDVHLCRLPGIALALLFGAYLLWWTTSFFGPKVGLLALFFYCVNPTIMANARLVTNDFAVLVFGAAAVMEWCRYLVNARWRTALHIPLLYIEDSHDDGSRDITCPALVREDFFVLLQSNARLRRNLVRVSLSRPLHPSLPVVPMPVFKLPPRTT